MNPIIFETPTGKLIAIVDSNVGIANLDIDYYIIYSDAPAILEYASTNNIGRGITSRDAEQLINMGLLRKL